MITMTDVSKTTPRRVLRRATELGVHADCVAADIDGSCDRCVDTLNDVFFEFYGHATSADQALAWIVEDILKDRQND